MIRKLALFFVLVLIAAACGDGSTGVDAAATTTTTPVETTTTTEATATTEATTTTEVMHDDGEMHDDDEAMHDDGMSDGGTVAEDGTPVDRTVEIAMTEFAFEPATVKVSAGETVKFVVHNAGVIEHEFRLSNAHRIEEHIASGHDDHTGDASEDGHHADGDVVLTLAADETGEIIVTFPDDASLFTEIACLIPSHYEAGMKGELRYGS